LLARYTGDPSARPHTSPLGSVCPLCLPIEVLVATAASLSAHQWRLDLCVRWTPPALKQQRFCVGRGLQQWQSVHCKAMVASGEAKTVAATLRCSSTATKRLCLVRRHHHIRPPARTVELRRDDPKLLLCRPFSTGGGICRPRHRLRHTAHISPHLPSPSTSLHVSAPHPAPSLVRCKAEPQRRERERAW
jgi:hypothetical protein